MAIEKQYLSDVAAILSHRHDNGADLWATPDNKLLKGSPFSTFDSVLYLLELGMSPQEPVLKAAADLISVLGRRMGDLGYTRQEVSILAKQRLLPTCYATWDMPRMKGFKKLFSIS